MICEKCGVILPDGLDFCTNCGAVIDEKEEGQSFSKLNKFLKILFVIILVAAVAIGSYKGINLIRINTFHNNLTCEWRRYSEDGTVLEFNISEDSIEYIVEYKNARKTLANLEYEVISPGEIIIPDRFPIVYKISFNSDKTKMTVTPAITSTDESEDWFYLE